MKKKLTPFELPKIVRIEGSNCVRFSNSHHLQFHFNVHELVTEVDKQKLHLSDALLKAWAECLELETEINKQAMATTQTDRMGELDRQRDDLLSNLFWVVKGQRKSPVELVRNAANELDKVLGIYTGIQFKSADDESADVRGMLKDLERLTDEIAALGLTPVVTALKTVNDEFQRVYKARQEKTMDLKLPPLAEVRPQTDAIFAAVCRYIEASHLFSEVAADRTMIERLVDRINQEADRFKATHKLSASLKLSAKEKKEVEKLLPAFESAQGFAPHSLSLTGKTAKDSDHAKLYELVSLSGESIWVKIEGGKLVKVPAPTKGIATSKAKAKKEDKK